MDPIIQALEGRIGLHFMGQPNVALQAENVALRQSGNGFACDAQPSLITTSNSGIPNYLSTYVDPKLIEVLVSPMKAAEIVGQEVKKGDWTTPTAVFPLIESTGEVSSYGDYSASGQAGANFNFPQRQSYTYQVITQWGEKELESAGSAKIDWANRLNISSALALNKFQNKTYFFGVSGLQNYGLLNDPSLSAAIVPTTKTAGGTTWGNGTPTENYNDVLKLFKQLVSQANGLVDQDTKMTLAMSPGARANLGKTNEVFATNVEDMIKKNFPNLVIKTAPEYSTTAGELVQLLADEIEGQRTADAAFTEKLRAHPIKVELSSFQQKKSQGTWGTVIYRPFLIAQMLGV